MDFDRLQRRSYLGGVVASLTGLAGCGGSQDDDATTEPGPAPDPATDIEASTGGRTNSDAETDDSPETDAPTPAPTETGESTETGTREPVAQHDHSDDGEGGNTLAPESVQASTVSGDRVEGTTVSGEQVTGTTVSGDRVDAETMRANRDPSGVHIAPPGELQSVLDSVEPGSIVRMRPERYQPGEEVTVPVGVTLDFNNGFIELASDHDVLFVDNGSRLIDPQIVIPTNLEYTSTVVHYDTTRTSGDGSQGAYDPNYDQHVDIESLRIKAPRYPEADHSESVGVHLDARGSYIMYNRIDGRISGLGTQVLGTTTSEDLVNNSGHTLRGYINGNRLKVDLRGAQDTHVRHAGDFKMRSLIQGEIQPTTNVTEYGIVNETRNKSLFFRGVFWDASSMNGAATKGSGITMDIEGGHVIDAEDIQEEPTNETTFFTCRDNVYGWFQRDGDGSSLGMRADDQRSRFFTDENESLHLFPSGGLAPPSQDLSSVEPGDRDHGAIYRHDGSEEIETRSGKTSTAGYYVWDENASEFTSVVDLPENGS